MEMTLSMTEIERGHASSCQWVTTMKHHPRAVSNNNLKRNEEAYKGDSSTFKLKLQVIKVRVLQLEANASSQRAAF